MVWSFVVMNLTLLGTNYKTKVIGMGGGDDELNFAPVPIIILNINQIYHVWKI